MLQLAISQISNIIFSSDFSFEKSDADSEGNQFSHCKNLK